MADANEVVTNSRYYCCSCIMEFDNPTSEFRCPNCMGIFVQILNNGNDIDESVVPVESVNLNLDNQQVQESNENENNNMVNRIEPTSTETAATATRILTTILRPNGRLATFRGGRRMRSSNAVERLSQHVRSYIQEGRRRFSNEPDFDFYSRSRILLARLNEIRTKLGTPPLSNKLIATIPIITVSQEQVDAKTLCSVCWEEYQQNESIKQLCCGHIFHIECINSWLEIHGNCPLCRENALSVENNMLQPARDFSDVIEPSNTTVLSFISSDSNSNGNDDGGDNGCVDSDHGGNSNNGDINGGDSAIGEDNSNNSDNVNTNSYSFSDHSSSDQ